MKRFLLPSLLLMLVVGFSSCAKSGMYEVDIDCTGTYLTKGNKDFKVCNLDIVAGLQDGDEVNVKFTRLIDCNDASQPDVVCELYHPYNSWVQVTSVDF